MYKSVLLILSILALFTYAQAEVVFSTETKEAYFGNCDPATKQVTVPGACTTDAALEKKLTDTYKCRWRNGVDDLRSSGKALQDVHDATNDWKALACVAYNFFYTSGYRACQGFQMISYAIYRSAAAKGIDISFDEINKIAEERVQTKIQGFNMTKHCDI